LKGGETWPKQASRWKHLPVKIGESSLTSPHWYLLWPDGERVGPYASSEAAYFDLQVIAQMVTV
jgi:hypothetical protein